MRQLLKEAIETSKKRKYLFSRSMGVKDRNGEDAHYYDQVIINTLRGRQFFRNRKFQKGDTAEVIRIKNLSVLKIRDSEDYNLTTIRAGYNLNLM